MSDASQVEGTPPESQAFGKYLLLHRVAVGGMAEVWVAKRREEDGSVSDLLALKRILPSLSDDEEFVTMFVDEARIAGQLSHPGVVSMFELGRLGHSYYIAMEFVWGRDLLGVLRRIRELRQPLAPACVAYVGARIAEALHYAHFASSKDGKPLNVVHRDVSPQNIILSFDGKVKLIDFGIAKAASRATKTVAGTLKGKVGYMSPEQVRGTPPLDHRSDQFALGTCLYEMATGRPLFARPNNFEALEKVREAEIPELIKVAPHVPPRLSEIVMKALSRDRDDRYANAHELQKALSLVVADVDPGFERFTLATWLRGLFRDELTEEKLRLDALDTIGREAAPPAGAKHRNSATQLEIATKDLFDDDDDAETAIFDGSPFTGRLLDLARGDYPKEPRPDGPYEVFFARDELVRVGEAPRAPVRPLKATFRPGKADAAESWRPPKMLEPRDTDPEPKPATKGLGDQGPSVEISLDATRSSTPAPAAPFNAEGTQPALRPSTPPREERTSRPSIPTPVPIVGADMEVSPAEIDSKVLKRMLPSAKELKARRKAKEKAEAEARKLAEAEAKKAREWAAKAGSTREPTQPTRTKTGASGRRPAVMVVPRRWGARDWLFLTAAALFLLLLGGSIAWFAITRSATASLEIRTLPSTNASVLIDGRARGRTPIEVDGLEVGRHTVTIVAPGYEPVTRELVLERGALSMDVALTPVVEAPP